MKKYIIKNKYPILSFTIPLVIGLVLSIFRYPGIDETIYLHDTAMIQHFISHGQWIGNESVGIHGFVFKLIVALIFLVTGKSIFVATLSNIIFASLTSLLTYFLAEKVLHNRIYALFVSMIMVSTYQFMGQISSYLRDMPVTFTMLLFILALLNKRNIWILSLLLLLVFDAKEYVALLLIPPFMIWLLYSEYQKYGLKQIKFYANIIYKPIVTLIPIAIWVFLMFWTSIIPVNSFVASMLNFYDTGYDYAKMQGLQAEQLLVQGNDTTGQGFKTIPLIANKDEDKKVAKQSEPLKKRLLDEYKEKVSSTQKRKIIVPVKNPSIQAKPIVKKTSKADSIRIAKLKIKQQDSVILAKLKIRQRDSINLLIAYQKSLDSLKKIELDKRRLEKSVSASITSEQKIQGNLNSVNEIEGDNLPKEKSLRYETKQLDTLREKNLSNKLESYGITIANYLLAYSQKILYPRVFSYLALPLLIVIPAVLMAFRSYREWKFSSYELVFLSVFVATYLMIYIMRNSHGRYLIHLFPILLLFFFRYLNDFAKYRKLFAIALATAFIFSMASLYFEIRDVEIKALSYFWFFGVLALLFVPALYNDEKIRKIIIYGFIGSFIFFNFGTSVYASLTMGDISRYLKYGYMGHYEKLANELGPDDIVLYNQWKRGPMIKYYREEVSLEMKGNSFLLKDFLPKKNLEKLRFPKTLYAGEVPFYWRNSLIKEDVLRNRIEEYGVNKIILWNSEIDKNDATEILSFSVDRRINSAPIDSAIKYFDTLKWLKKDKILKFKNSEAHIYRVLYDE